MEKSPKRDSFLFLNIQYIYRNIYGNAISQKPKKLRSPKMDNKNFRSLCFVTGAVIGAGISLLSLVCAEKRKKEEEALSEWQRRMAKRMSKIDDGPIE